MRIKKKTKKKRCYNLQKNASLYVLLHAFFTFLFSGTKKNQYDKRKNKRANTNIKLQTTLVHEKTKPLFLIRNYLFVFFSYAVGFKSGSDRCGTFMPQNFSISSTVLFFVSGIFLKRIRTLIATRIRKIKNT
jgi:hypothetical protein